MQDSYNPTQVEIKYFFPLTEQIALDLDFIPSENYLFLKRNREGFSTVLNLNCGTGLSGTVTWAQVNPTYENFQVLPDGAVGSWQVTPNMSVGRKSKPKLLHRIFTKLMLGWEWKDK